MFKDHFRNITAVLTFCVMGTCVAASAQAFTCGTDTVSRDGITYGTVAGADGNCWLDRNLGATRQATAYNDTQAYGWLFQWGRGADGHQITTSSTTTTVSAIDAPGHGNFIISSSSPYDWRVPQNSNLWQGSSGVNNPCPAGWRIPTSTEWATVVSTSGITNTATAFGSSLKLVVSGRRDGVGGGLQNQGLNGYYWSSTPGATNANLAAFKATSKTVPDGDPRLYGAAIRCVRDPFAIMVPSASTQSSSAITATSATGNGTVTATGGEDPTRYIEWGTVSGNYTHSCTAGTGGTGTYSCAVTSLTPQTTYYVRAKVMNSAGTSYGDETSFTTTAFSCGSTVSYGDKNYQTVQIGAQCWFKENLNIGTMLVNATTMPSSNSVLEKWCYGNSSVNCNSYGGLYTWAEANGLAASCSSATCSVPSPNQGICPSGWHIPTDTEFKILEVNLGMTQAQADSQDAWRGTISPQLASFTPSGNNSSGFSALPAGMRDESSNFSFLGSYTLFWTASEYSAGGAWRRDLYSSNVGVYRRAYSKSEGYSIRCVRDGAIISTSTTTTNSATNITPVSASLNAEITNTGGNNPERQIEYGTASHTYTQSCTQGTGGVGTYSCTISNLTPNTQYFYRAKSINSAGTSYGNELSFTTQSIPAEVTIPDPDDSALSNAVTSAYFSVNQGTQTSAQEIETNTQIHFTSANVKVTLPLNTTITEQNNNIFNFTNFVTENTTSQIRQFAPSRAAVKIGVPNTRMEFSQPITITLTVGQAYNNKVMDILYQEDGETTWNTHTTPTCTITDGKCTFQTTHATTYTVNNDGTVSGAAQNDITTDVQDVLSMDCDQTGNTNDNIVEFGNLTPGTPVTGSTTCTVTTNSDAGYTLAAKREDANSTMDKDSDTATDITDRTPWNNSTPNATIWNTNDTGLAFTVYNTTATKNTTWWGTGTTVTDVNNKYAGFPTSYTDIMQHTEYDETATTVDIGYKLDVPTTQKSGIYSGDITYQVVTAP